MQSYDAVIVGARCAGSVLAGSLAHHGWKVLLVDKATFPSDTVSTHVLFPNTLDRFETLGVLERLHDRHRLSSLATRWRILGHEIAGEYTPVGGHSRGTCIRRVSLDAVLVDWARDAGVETRFGTRVTSLIGSDPVEGVVLDSGEEVRARWVIGADGRASTVAKALGLEKQDELAGEFAYLMAYWRGLPDRDFFTIDVDDRQNALLYNPCEDGTHLVCFTGPPSITRGTKAERERRYAEGARLFSDSVDPAALDRAERISDLIVVPETMLRGFYRQPVGPGWALVGDAGHFKHPATAQGISDAVEQAVYVAGALNSHDPELESFEAWRAERSGEHYEYSYSFGRWPRVPASHAYFDGIASDPAASQDFLDVLTREKKPSELHTPARMSRWFAAAA
jgi:2-polyprenyl-6-methoxyphenol hydroxylase-like FAD-dependent oxidoreductase